MLWFLWVLEKEAATLQIATIVESLQTKHIENLIRALERSFYSDNYSGGGYGPWEWIWGVTVDCSGLLETLCDSYGIGLKLISGSTSF